MRAIRRQLQQLKERSKPDDFVCISYVIMGLDVISRYSKSDRFPLQRYDLNEMKLVQPRMHNTNATHSAPNVLQDQYLGFHMGVR